MGKSLAKKNDSDRENIPPKMKEINFLLRNQQVLKVAGSELADQATLPPMTALHAPYPRMHIVRKTEAKMSLFLML